jgi:hypothetical protein
MMGRRRAFRPPDDLDMRVEAAVRRAWDRMFPIDRPRGLTPQWYGARLLEQSMQAEVEQLDRRPRWRR